MNFSPCGRPVNFDVPLTKSCEGTGGSQRMRPLVPADYPGGNLFKKPSKRSSDGKASQARSTSSSVTGEALSTP